MGSETQCLPLTRNLNPETNLFLYSFMVKTESTISANKSHFSPSSLVSGTALAGIDQFCHPHTERDYRTRALRHRVCD